MPSATSSVGKAEASNLLSGAEMVSRAVEMRPSLDRYSYFAYPRFVFTDAAGEYQNVDAIDAVSRSLPDISTGYRPLLLVTSNDLTGNWRSIVSKNPTGGPSSSGFLHEISNE